MAAIQLICPHCKATLTFNQAIPGGTPVICLSCNRPFSIAAAAMAPPPAGARPRPAVNTPAAAAVPVPHRPGISKPAATRPAVSVSRTVPPTRDPAPTASGGGRMAGGIMLVLFALLFFGGLAFLVYATGAWHRLFDSPPPILAEGPKDKADKDQAEKDEAAKDKVDKGPSNTGIENPAPVESGKKDDTKPLAKGSDTKKDGKQPTDGGVDVADEKQPDKKPVPIVPDPPVKSPDKSNDDGKKKDAPEIKIVVEAPPIAPGVTQAHIDKAIDRGVEYLRKTYRGENELWGGGEGGYVVGYASFAGLALLECKVPAKDPLIQQAATAVRASAGKLTHTYQASLAVLFLDKLGDPQDDALIRGLGLRILSGQKSTGAWLYTFEELSVQGMTAYHGYLREHFPWSKAVPRPKNAHVVAMPDGQDGDKDAKKKGAKPLPIDLSNLPADTGGISWQANISQGPGKFMPLGGDNSNTQFALLALWAARRHDVPAECPILLSYQRFRSTQNPDGGWAYKTEAGFGGKPEKHSTHTMTCAGLLGLALGPGALPPGSNVGDKEKIQQPVSAGLTSLGAHIGSPGPAGAKPAMENMYFLWSVERVGVLFDLKSIGGKDWYAWGAQMLVANQDPRDGHWHGAPYMGQSDHLDTCFALLFLKRANLVADLTETLKVRMPIRDPAAR